MIKKNNLDRALVKYCAYVSGCGIPSPDLLPVKINQVVAQVTGETIYCRQGFNLLSCGQTNMAGIILFVIKSYKKSFQRVTAKFSTV